MTLTFRTMMISAPFKSSILATLACFSLLGLQTAPAQQVATGEIRMETVHGDSLENSLMGENPDRTVAVYLPPSYAEDEERRYPVLYLLHGIGGTERDWVQPRSTGKWWSIKAIMDNGIAESRFKEMIIVAPSAMTTMGGSFYTNSPVTGNWEDFTCIDLVQYVDANFRTLEQAGSRAIAGHSMGGYGAIKLGMKNPDIFQVVYGMNAAILGWAGDLSADNMAFARAATVATPKVDMSDFYKSAIVCISQALSPAPEKGPLFFDLPFVLKGRTLQVNPSAHAAWEREMPLYMVAEYQDNLRSLKGLRFDSGRFDEFSHIIVTNRVFSDRLTGLSVPHIFEEYNGDHRNRLWGPEGRLAGVILPWISRMLAHQAAGN
jgi:S-formylglutathione hydrolase FrmB